MKYYKQGDQCTFKEDTEEYKRLKDFAKLLTENSPNKHNYVVKDTYLDYGQRWEWTTIINATEGYQAICPAEWFEIVNMDRSFNHILEDWLNDKHNPDRIR